MTIIKTRTDTAANFTSANTLLAAGERAIESDTLKEKVGPGNWNTLDYVPTGGASAYDDLTDSDSADLPTINAPLATALDAKAPGGSLIIYGSTGRSLTAGDNGNIIRCTSNSAVSMTVPIGLPDGFSCLLVQAGTGVVTAVQGSGVTLTANPALVTNGAETDILIVPAGTNAYTSYTAPSSSGGGATTLAELTDIATFDLGVENDSVAAIKATADAALGGSSTLCVISGTRGTGNTLTATVGSGYAGTFQWQSLVASTWTNVTSGGTSATHVELVGDLHRDIRCVFTPTTFTTNTLVQPAPTFTAQSPPDADVGDSYSYSYVASGAASYALASGSLPTGASLNTSTGAITGTVTAAGTFTFVISATNSGGTTNASSQDVVITNTASGALSVTKITGVDMNLTTYGTIDWLDLNSSSGGGFDDWKSGGGEVLHNSIALTNMTRVNGSTAGHTVNWTDGTNSAVDSKGSTGIWEPTSGGTIGYVDFFAPANTSTHKVRVVVNCYTGGRSSANLAVRFHLSDSSAADQSSTLNIDSGGFGTVQTIFEATYNAGASGQTLRIRVENTDGVRETDEMWLGIQAVTYGT